MSPPSSGGCVSNPASNQGAGDAACAKCPEGQTWWPCGVVGTDGQPVCIGDCSPEALVQGSLKKASVRARGFLAQDNEESSMLQQPIERFDEL